MTHSNANCAMFVDVIVTITTVVDDAMIPQSASEYAPSINLLHNSDHIIIYCLLRFLKNFITFYYFITNLYQYTKYQHASSNCNTEQINESKVVCQIKQANFKKIVISPTSVWFCYLFNGICFHFRLCVTGIPADLRMMHYL